MLIWTKKMIVIKKNGLLSLNTLFRLIKNQKIFSPPPPLPCGKNAFVLSPFFEVFQLFWENRQIGREVAQLQKKFLFSDSARREVYPKYNFYGSTINI